VQTIGKLREVRDIREVNRVFKNVLFKMLEQRAGVNPVQFY
jgi:hypothetical protein